MGTGPLGCGRPPWRLRATASGQSARALRDHRCVAVVWGEGEAPNLVTLAQFPGGSSGLPPPNERLTGTPTPETDDLGAIHVCEVGDCSVRQPVVRAQLFDSIFGLAVGDYAGDLLRSLKSFPACFGRADE